MLTYIVEEVRCEVRKGNNVSLKVYKGKTNYKFYSFNLEPTFNIFVAGNSSIYIHSLCFQDCTIVCDSPIEAKTL